MFAYHMRLGWPKKVKHKNDLVLDFGDQDSGLIVAKEPDSHALTSKI